MASHFSSTMPSVTSFGVVMTASNVLCRVSARMKGSPVLVPDGFGLSIANTRAYLHFEKLAFMESFSAGTATAAGGGTTANATCPMAGVAPPSGVEMYVRL